jgi:hypothetical protein
MISRDVIDAQASVGLRVRHVAEVIANSARTAWFERISFRLGSRSQETS